MPLSLIDTDILSEFLKQRDSHVLQNGADYLAQYRHFAISAMTRYEVMRGLKDKNATQQLKNFEIFCQNNKVFPITDTIFDRASDIWVEGRKGGHPRYDPDLIIAATALEHDRVLVTGNTPHFDWIPGLTIENWRDA
jgi:predicted nucleic acid-binding protein